MKRTVLEILESHPEEVALIDHFKGRRWTYREVAVWSAAVAQNLHDLGVRPGDRVAIQLENCPEYVFLHLGINRLGAAAVPIEPGGKNAEEILAHCNPSCLIAVELPTIRGLLGVPLAQVMELKPGSTRSVEEHQMRPEDPIVILYTSGSTGKKAKGVIHTWSSMNCDFEEYGRAMGFSGEATIIQPMSVNHADGWCFSLYLPLLWGASVVLLPKFDARVAFAFDRILQGVAKGVLIAVPEILSALCDAKPRYREEVAGHLACAITSSVKLTEAVRGRFERLFDTRVMENYGLTETLLIAYFDPQTQHREGSVGRVARACEIRIVDDEVVVRSPFLFAGYFGDPKGTAEVLRNGWFYTGDLGHVDEEGYFFLKGRRQEILNWRGIKVNVVELSQQLRKLERVSDLTLVKQEREDHEAQLCCYIVFDQGSDPDLPALKRKIVELVPDGVLIRQLCIVRKIPRGLSGKVLVPQLEEYVTSRYE